MPTITATNASGIYNGLAYEATATVTGINGVLLASGLGTLAYNCYLASDSTLGVRSAGLRYTSAIWVVAHFAASNQSSYTSADSLDGFDAIFAQLTVTANNASRTYGAQRTSPPRYWFRQRRARRYRRSLG